MTPYRTTAGCGLAHIARNVFYAGFLKTFAAQAAGVAASAGQSRVRGSIAGYGLGIVHPQLCAQTHDIVFAQGHQRRVNGVLPPFHAGPGGDPGEPGEGAVGY